MISLPPNTNTPCTFTSLATNAKITTNPILHNPQSEAPSKTDVPSSSCVQVTPTHNTNNVSRVGNRRSKPLSARNEILHLGSIVGHLCTQILTYAPLDDTPSANSTIGTTSTSPITSGVDFWKGEDDDTSAAGRDEIYSAVAMVFATLLTLCTICGIDLRTSILKKVELNKRKYPVELCKGKSGKYTKYSSQTGITKTNQSTIDVSTVQDLDTVPEVTRMIREFAMERKWTRYHTPRNIVLAMLGEVGELAELFQWRGDEEGDGGDSGTRTGLKAMGWKEEDIDGVQQEIADVAIYCLRLADVIGIEDLGQLSISIQIAKFHAINSSS